MSMDLLVTETVLEFGSDLREACKAAGRINMHVILTQDSGERQSAMIRKSAVCLLRVTERLSVRWWVGS